MSDPNKSIFLDLEIDVETMITEPDVFAKDVYAAADKLLNVLNNKSSIKGANTEMERKAAKDKSSKEVAKTYFSPYFDELYDKGETMPIEELFHLIKEVESLAKDLSITFHSRAKNTMIMNSPNSTDKKLAHMQYMELKTAFEAFRQFAKLMNDKVYSPLEPKTGNYSADSATVHPAYIVDGHEVPFNNYRAVARLLEWDPDEFKSHMDLCDRLTTEDIKTVKIVQVTL